MKTVKCGCGGEAYVDTLAQVMGVSKPWFRVVCDKCETQTDTYETEAEAIEAWNLAMGAEPETFVVPIIASAYKIEFTTNGEIIAEGWACQNCGGYVQENDKYCKNCGCRLEWK